MVPRKGSVLFIVGAHTVMVGRPGSVVSIATGCGLDGPGIESRWGRDFPQTGPGAHPASCTMGTGSFPGGKERRRRDADPSPPSSAVVIKGQSYTSTLPMGRTACTEPECMYKGALFTHCYDGIDVMATQIFGSEI
jgi:hypothetical protein